MTRELTPEQIDHLAKEWAHALARGEEAREDPVHQQVVMLTFFYSPQTQWDFVLAALRHVKPNDLGHAAVGPFEGLMGKHGDDFIDRVEAEAAGGEKFNEMVRDVYQHMMSDEVWSRVQALQT